MICMIYDMIYYYHFRTNNYKNIIEITLNIIIVMQNEFLLMKAETVPAET